MTAVAADPQRLAADPRLSAFVTANAGSGKTKTLIDRVARLLLAGARPETVLCVTYTKAAAAEMQRRLYRLLGQWSIHNDKALAKALADLEGREAAQYDAIDLSKARALFASALETPGGLKIQTIHAFCEKLLRRFPLEAGLSPGFRVMDDPAAAATADAARKAVARRARGGEGAVAEAYARFSVALDFQSFQSMFAGFEAQRGGLRRYFAACGGPAGAVADVWRVCGFDGPTEPECVEAQAMAALNRAAWRDCVEVLAQGGKADIANAGKLARALASDAALDDCLAPLFTEKGESSPAAWVAKTSGLKGREDLRAFLLDEQTRLEGARERRRAARVAQDTVGALALAAAYLSAYDIEKAATGGLDFTDLIEKTRDLVASRPMAAWVLYKLDGGVDHILVDEAQDTAPEQWEIVRALSEEFFSGSGKPSERRLERNMFVVGDEKQSIYSFQGARPELLLQEFQFHRDRATGAGLRFERVDLLTSWRSTPQVLAFVDAAFAPPELAAAILPRTEVEAIIHQAVRTDPGCVDLWPLIREEKADVRQAWDAPLDEEGAASANKRLAARIADEIAALIARGDAVLDKETRAPRPATAGDVLILVRRRKALFEEILRALKHRKIPVAGADRLALSEHIVFADLLAVARFAQFPTDELTLAALLRSPFCDLSDASLFDLAHGRGTANLAEVLTARRAERPEWEAAAALLEQILATRAARPFEFYAGLLSLRDGAGRSMRRRLLERLGSEAQDALDEFLAQTAAAESRGIEDLESLAAALADLDITVKREMEAGRDEVRVMTAHGAKGLEAPIVFLPETTLSRTARGSPLMPTPAGGFLWSASKATDCEASLKARDWRAKKEEDEAARLLYVALTRARDRLVLCGRISATAKEENLKGWWGAVAAALEHGDLAGQVRGVRSGDTEFLRFGPDPIALGAADAIVETAVGLPAWTQADPRAEAFARYASPSRLGDDAVAPAASPLAKVAGLGRFRRGDLIHRLLQILPDLLESERPDAARRILAREPDLTEAQMAEMSAAALGVLDDPVFCEVFGPGGRAEVSVAGTARGLPPGLAISGRIDRLVVLEDRVLAVDFKTNRPSPARIEDADRAYLRQMAIYAAVLEDIFEGRRIEAALVWTDGPKLMVVPENLRRRILDELRRGG